MSVTYIDLVPLYNMIIGFRLGSFPKITKTVDLLSEDPTGGLPMENMIAAD